MIKYILFSVFVLSTSIYAQFDSLIFMKNLRLTNSGPETVSQILPLGDQNNDGCDDILVYSCADMKIYLYYGGSPMDTIPDMVFNRELKGWTTFDMDGDGRKEFVLSRITYKNYPDTTTSTFEIYYGGESLDTIPDFVFHNPAGTHKDFGYYLSSLKDFNGDGRSELLIYDIWDHADHVSDNQYGGYYIYNTGSIFDTLDYKVIKGDTKEKILMFHDISSGDINGDGLTDFSLQYFDEKITQNLKGLMRKFFMGNRENELLPDVTYKQTEHSFYVDCMRIIGDYNKDGSDDILIKDYGNKYPYYYLEAILFGSFPIDTVQDIGLNTQNQDFVWHTITVPGDVNGDGYSDLLTQSPMSHDVKIFLGGHPLRDNIAARRYYGELDGFGRMISEVGDVDGDGVDDICIGKISPVLEMCSESTIFIIKGDTTVKVPTEVKEDKDVSIIEGYELMQPYPNPFNSSTVISYVLPHNTEERTSVELKVFSTLGEEVTDLSDKASVHSGRNEVSFDAGQYSLPSGIYIVRLQVLNSSKITYSESRKITYLK